MKSTILFSSLFFSVIFISSCKKKEGQGGTSAITGSLTTKLYNTSDSLIDSYPKANEDVFIIYGEGNTVYNDKVSTSYDGSFKFDYLEKGKYTVYYYEDCATCPEGHQVKLLTPVITKRMSTVELGSIDVKKISNKGTATISGSVHVMNYNSLGVFVNEGPGADIDVYIIYGNSSLSYSDRIKSNYDGTFSFPNLANGSYKVYAYSNCSTCPDGLDEVVFSTEVVTQGSTVNIGEITINQ